MFLHCLTQFLPSGPHLEFLPWFPIPWPEIWKYEPSQPHVAFGHCLSQYKSNLIRLPSVLVIFLIIVTKCLTASRRLAHPLDSQSIVLGTVQGSSSHHRREEAGRAYAQASLVSIISTRAPQPMEWSPPHSRWTFHSELILLEMPVQKYPGVCSHCPVCSQ